MTLALRHWRKILTLVVLGFLGGIGYLSIAPKIYLGVAQIEIEPTEKRVVRVDSITNDLGTDRSIIDGQIELMQSASLARSLIKDLKLFIVPGDAAVAATGASDAPLGVPDELVERLLGNMKVERVGQTLLVNISYQSSDPHEAAAVANAIGRAYMQHKQDAKLEATRGASQWLETQIEQMRTKLQTLEQAILQYRIDHNLVQIGNVNLNEIEIGEYTKNLVAVRTNAQKASARVRQLDAIGADKIALRGLDFVAESKQIADMERSFADLKNKEADLRTRFGTNHPDVANTQDQLKELDKRIDIEVQRIAEGVRQSSEIAKKEVALLEADFAKLKGDLTHKNLETLQLGEMERDLEATRALYVNFLTRLKETTAQESLPTETANFVSEAFAPSKPFSPKRWTVLAISSLIGLALGYLLATLFELAKLRRPAPASAQAAVSTGFDNRSGAAART